jgi:hypothetical protein
MWWYVLYFVHSSDGKRPPGRPRRTRLYNIEMNLGEMSWGGMDWIVLTEGRDVMGWDGLDWSD